MVCWTVYTVSASIEDMRIDHGRTDILMAQQFVDRPNIVTVLKQMRGKRMPEGVTTGRFGDPSFPDGFFHSPLQDGFVKMMPFLLKRGRYPLLSLLGRP